MIVQSPSDDDRDEVREVFLITLCRGIFAEPRNRIILGTGTQLARKTCQGILNNIVAISPRRDSVKYESPPWRHDIRKRCFPPWGLSNHVASSRLSLSVVTFT